MANIKVKRTTVAMSPTTRAKLKLLETRIAFEKQLHGLEAGDTVDMLCEEAFARRGIAVKFTKHATGELIPIVTVSK